MSLFSLTITMFLIMNSVGHLSAFVTLMRRVPEAKRAQVLARELLVALGIMIFFHFFGELLLNALGVSASTVQLSSGIVLFLIAVRMIFPHESYEQNLGSGEPFIVPLATPMIAGPSILATIMLYAYTESSESKVLLAIMVAWSLSAIIFGLSLRFKPYLNERVLTAAERLMGLILSLIAVEMALQGLRLFVKASAYAAL